MGSEVFGCERVRMKEEVSGSMLVKLCEVGWRRHSRRRFKKKKKSSGACMWRLFHSEQGKGEE